MKAIVLIAVIALTVTSSNFLRNLVVDITLSGFKTKCQKLSKTVVQLHQLLQPKLQLMLISQSFLRTVHQATIASDVTLGTNDILKATAAAGFTTKMSSKNYIALDTQTEQKVNFTDKKGSFNILFKEAITADDLPTVKIDTTTLTCKASSTAKTVTCDISQENFNDTTKTYTAKVTNVCGDEETTTVSVKVNSSSFITVSKFIALCALFLL